MDFKRPAAIRYLVAVLAAAAAIGLRLALDPILGVGNFPFITLLVVLPIVSWHAGLGSGLVALILGGLGSAYLMAPFAPPPPIAPGQQAAAFATYLVVGSVAVLFGSAYRRTSDVVESQASLCTAREEQLRAALGSVSDALLACDREQRVTFASDGLLKRAGLPAERVLGRRLQELDLPSIGDDALAEPETAGAELEMAAARREPMEYERFDPAQGGRWYANKAYPAADGGLTVFSRDITEAKRTDILRQVQSAIVELIAEGEPLDACLQALTASVPTLGLGLRACVLVADRERSTIAEAHGAGVSDTFCRALRGAPIGETPIGTCGEAIRSGQPVACDDIAASALWAETWKSLCASEGIRACYSAPVTLDGSAVASFFLCMDEPRPLNDWERRVAEFGAHACAIVLMRERAAQALLKQHGVLTELVDRCPFGIYIVDADFRMAHVNAGSRLGPFANVQPLLGRDFAEVIRVIWPEPVATEIVAEFRRTLESGRPYYSREFVQPRGDIDAVEGYEWELHRIALPDGRDGVVCYYYDSTELRMVERRLRASEERFRLIVESVRDFAIVTFDVRGMVTSWNRGAEHLLGWTEDEAVGQDGAMIFTTEDVGDGVPQRELAAALREGRAEGERWQVRQDGARFWGNTLTVPLRHEGEPTSGLLKIIRDRTEARAAERRLTETAAQERRRAALLQTVLDTSPAPIWIAVDRDCNHVLGNPAADALLGVSAGTNVARSATNPEARAFRCFSQGKELADEDLPLRRAARDNVTVHETELEILRSDGSRVWILTHASPFVHDGLPTGAIAVAVDITARKRAEQQVSADLKATTRLQLLATQLAQPDAAIEGNLRHLLDAALDIAEADAGLIQLTDTRAETLRIAIHHGLDPEVVSLFAEQSPCAANALDTITEDRVLIKDLARATTPCIGSEVLHDAGVRALLSIPLLASNGDLLGVLSILWSEAYGGDQRTLRLLDLLSRQAMDFLERRRTEQELRTANRRKDEFLATLAHELRNPLAPVRTGLYLLRQGGGEAEANAKLVTMMDRQIDHVVRLVDDLLEVSRITRGKITLRRHPTELAAVIDDAAAPLRETAEAAGLTLTTEVPAEPVVIDADPVRIAQIVSNLLSNAIKYTDRGGHIAVSARSDGNEAIIAVRDEGIGIPEDMLPRVFDLFTQVDQSLGRAKGGLGIGLALVKRLVELHGGTVEARSAGRGSGSEFVVRLPVLSLANDAPPKRASAHREASFSGLRVLVVDDNRDAADSLVALLQAANAVAEAVYDGPAALAALPRLAPAVMLLDIGMPGMDGIEVAQRVRAQPRFRDLRMIALTGWGQAHDRARTRSAGFDLHLTKPVSSEKLLDILATIASEAGT